MDTDDGLTCTAEEDIELASATARKYGLSFHIVDLQQAYWDNVVAYTVDRVRRGLTPNPDVMCNKLIKFGCFDREAGQGYDKIATGHYASTLDIDGYTWLATAKDPVKDQTDFLAQIDYLQVSRLMFPLGGFLKEEVRDMALKASLPSARRKDSQGICFLGKINYNDFIRRFLGERPGPVVELETGKVIGQHRGYWFHTIGQRKGLGLALGYPAFVLEIRPETNEVVVGRNKDLFTEELVATDFNWISGEAPTGEIKVSGRTRYHQPLTEGVAKVLENGDVKVSFDEPIRAITKGQSVVLYDGDVVLGGGTIKEC